MDTDRDAPAPENIADYACGCGEGPLWHPDERALYWVDIASGRLFRYDPATGGHAVVYEGETIGGFTIQDDGALLLFMARGRVATWRDGALSTVLEDIPDERATRFNDVIADPRGRVFCGTMPTAERKGRLYRLDGDGSLHLLLEDVGIANGMGFTPDHRHLYFTDSQARTIWRFAYDEETGAIGERSVFVETPEGEGVPDGMTVDADGFVWSARWDGDALFRYAPDGTLERTVAIPARKASCCTFGGPDYRHLYVTTAGGDRKDRDGEGAGALYRLAIDGVAGVPEFRSAIHP